MSTYLPKFDASYFNGRSPGHLPGLLGINILEIGQDFIRAELSVRRELFAPNGFLHAGSVVTLADTACGYGCVAHLPEGALMTSEGTAAMLACYTAAPRRHTRVAPADSGVRQIGHFGLFRKEMAGHWPRITQMLDELPATGAQRNTR